MTLKILSAVVGLLVVAGGILYTFGTPQAPDPGSPLGSVPAASAQGGYAQQPQSAEGYAEAADAAPQAGTEPAPPDPSSPLAIEIPGCVCHSDDPKQVEQHKGYRMNQCASCHAGRTPTGAE